MVIRMTLRDTQEAHGALFTAGALMLILRLLVATFRTGSGLAGVSWR